MLQLFIEQGGQGRGTLRLCSTLLFRRKEMKRAAKSSTASVGLILHSSLLSLTLGLAVTLTIVLASAWHEFSWARHVQALAAFDRVTYETGPGGRLARTQLQGAHSWDANPTPKSTKLHQDND